MAFVRGHFPVHAANQDVGLQTDAQHFFNGMLGRLGFDFACGGDVGNVAQVRKQGVVASQLAAHLTDSFQKRQRFDVADCAADFDDGHIVTRRAFVDAAFDFVRLIPLDPLYKEESIIHGYLIEIGERRVGKECRSRWSPYH